MTIATGTVSIVTANWNEQKEKLKAKFSRITDANLKFESDKKNEMLTKVQTKLAKSKEKLTAIIAAL